MGQRMLTGVNRMNDKPLDAPTSAVEWMKAARATIRSRGETDIHRFERRIIVGLLCVVLAVSLVAAIIARVAFSRVADKMMAVAPDRQDWQDHVRSVLLPVELGLTFGGFLFLLAMLFIFTIALLCVRRLVFSSEFSLKFLKTPQQQAANLAIECVDIYFSSRTARRFALAVVPLLAICSLGAYLLCKCVRIPDRTFLTGAYWFIPVITGVPLFFAVRAVCGRTQRLLKGMKMLDTELHRFMSLRLLWFGRHCLILVVVASVILLSMPLPGSLWTRYVEDQLLVASEVVVTKAPDDLKRVSQEEYETRRADLVQQVKEKPLDMKHWMGLWPVGFRAIAGAAICVGAALLLAGLLLPSAGAERKNAASYLLWEAAVTLGVAITVGLFWGLMPEMTLSDILIYVLSVLVAFGLTFMVTHVVEFGRMTVRCPYCGRSSAQGGTNCPWCGVWLDVACRINEAEFTIPARSDTVHHRDCPTLRKRDGAQFRTLEEAVHHRLVTGAERAVACKRCLGVSPKWEPDPAWSRAHKWVERLNLFAVDSSTDSR